MKVYIGKQDQGESVVLGQSKPMTVSLTGGMGMSRDYAPGGWSKKVMESHEGKVIEQSPTFHAVAATALEFGPFTRFLIPSGKENFEQMSTPWKVATLAADALSVFGIGMAAKAFTGVSSIGRRLLGSLPRKTLRGLDTVEQSLPRAFMNPSVVERLAGKYKLASDEAEMVLKWQESPIYWGRTGRSGGLVQAEPSAAFQKLLTPKTQKLRVEVTRDIEKWKNMTPDQARYEFYREGWEKEISKLPYGKVLSKPKNLKEVIREQAKKYMPIEDAIRLNFDDVTPELMANFWLDALEPGRRLLKLGEPSISMIPKAIKPSRKVYGPYQRFYQAYDNIYSKLKEVFGTANKYEFDKIHDLNQRIVAAGLGKLVAKVADNKIVSMKLKPNFAKEEWTQLGVVARQLDDMAGEGYASIKEATKELGRVEADKVTLEMTKVIEAERRALLNKQTKNVRTLYEDVWQPWHNALYKEHLLLKIPQVLERFGLSNKGKLMVEKLMSNEGIVPALDGLLNPRTDFGFGVVGQGIEDLLEHIRGLVDPSWFTRRSIKNMEKTIEGAKKALSTGGKDIPGYVENYAMRIGLKGRDLAVERATSLLGARHAGYVKSRWNTVATKPEMDTSLILEARARAQAKDLFVYPYIPDVVKAANETTTALAEYTEHYIARLMGEPSLMDHKLAQFLTASIGRIETALGRSGVWDAYRVQRMAHLLNDMVYLGALGFKPFSAIRNLFQPLITVPADMGGIKDLAWLTVGTARAAKADVRQYLRGIGAIQEFAPDIYLRQRILDFGPKIKGVQLPHMQAVRDVGLWMFQQSDRFSRYTTGAAAMSKWEHYAQKFLINDWKPDVFMKKMKFHGRDAWVRRELEAPFRDLTRRPSSVAQIEGALEEAKRLYINDVIADTQFLYGIAESPQLTYKGGGLSKTAFIFQTWWMNYMTALGKWVTGTDLNFAERVGRSVTAILSSAIAYEIMVHGAGFKESTAARSVFLGPIPRGVSGFSYPPTWAPIVHTITGLGVIGDQAFSKMVGGEFDAEKITSQANSLFRSVSIMIPGGLMVGQAIRRGMAEGPSGAAQSLIGYYPKGER